jgi:hypothetical protein
MWLPTPAYERIPQFLFLLGLLFMSAGTYIGFDYQLTFFYFGVGFGCSTWGLCLFAMRRRARMIQDRQRESTDNLIPGAGSAT